MEKETERISKSLAIVERQINELKDSGNKTALDILRKKEARLKEELKGTQMSTNALAKNLLAQRKNIKGLSKIEFNDLIRRLSKRPEYSFLKTMPKDKIKTDLQRTAKPVGWRFKGRGNYDKPTAKQIVAGKKSGTVYNERRPLRSDVSQVVKLKEGGNVNGKWIVWDEYTNKIVGIYSTEAQAKKGINFDENNSLVVFPKEQFDKNTNNNKKIEFLSNGEIKHTNKIQQTFNSESGTFEFHKVEKSKIGEISYEYDLDGLLSESLDSDEFDSELYITNIEVNKDYRNLGVAKKLLAKIISFAKEKGIDVITIRRDDGVGSNKGSDYDNYLKSIFEKMGFEDNDEDTGMYLPLNKAKMKQGGKIDVKPYEFTKDGKTIMINGTQSDIKKMYLDYVNNFLTISAFADHYDISDKQAENIISKGKELSESSGTYENGGNIDDYISKNKFLHDPIDEKEVLEEATYKVDRIKNGKSTATLESIKEDLKEHKMSLYRLDIGTLKPARIIGTGYRGNTRKIANTWLLKQIAINEKAIELLEEPTAKKSTSSSSSELYIKTIAEKTATRPLAVKKFVEYHKLNDNQVLNLMQGIGMGTIKGSDFASAIVGDKVSEKAIVKFAKSKEAFKTPKTITANALKDASYVSNRDIISLTIKKGSDTITINGNDILDGVYLKNNITMSTPKESASDIVLKIITKAKQLDKQTPFWGNLKERMTIVTETRVQKLLDAGYDTKEIMIIYLGIYSVFDVTIDGEVAYNKVSGLFDYETSYVDEQIDKYIGISKSNEYELGLKYPELDWSKIIEKYKISKNPKIINGEKRKFGNTLRMDIYAIYQGEDVVVSTNIDVEVTENGVKQPKSSFNSKKAVTDGKFNNGYWGITSSKKEIIMDILSMIVTQDSSSYVKDINVFFNGLGGAHAETLIENKIKFEQGGNIGRTISFMDWRGDVRKGVITERLKKGYEVMTPQGVALVEDSEIIE